MHFLGYWVYNNFLEDISTGATFHYNSNQPRFHKKIEIGESLWLATGIRVKGKMEYHLAARFVIRAKTHNPVGYKYGRFRLWADPQLSDYYVIGEKEMTNLLLSLEFVPKKPIQEHGVTIAQSLQTFRYLSSADVQLLEEWRKMLTPNIDIPRVVPEMEIEDSYEHGEHVLKNKINIELPKISPTRRVEIVSNYQRNRSIIKNLHERYTGRCQICAFDPISVYGINAACAHHIHYLSRGGLDSLENLILLCPNHHAVIHGDDAVFDYEKKIFIFSNGRQEPLALNQHL